jgi:hypothetical protein
MEILRSLAQSLQHDFGPELHKLADVADLIQRKRKFDAVTLLRTLVMTVLKHPQPTPGDFKKTADQLGVHVSRTAILNRFTNKLIAFLKAPLEQALAAQPQARDLLQNFTAVFIGDATSFSLPEAYAKEFAGCRGTQGTVSPR